MHSDLKDKFQLAQSQGLSMVAWRLPNQAELHMMGPAEEKFWRGEAGEEPCFVFSPFSNELNAFCIGSHGEPNLFKSSPIAPNSFDASHYKELVARAVEGIRKGDFDKIVAARVIALDDSSFEAIEHFFLLMDKHPNAFCYLWYSPSTGLWMGASPELLMERKGDSIRTMALAGTRSSNQGDFGNKEMEEQDLVLKYLEETLAPFVDSLNTEQKTKAHSGHLTHLKNELSGVLKQDVKSIYALLQALHPTPAVAGLPKEKAIDFIAKEEGFSRSYYAGFLGLHTATSSQLFVNLRCMQIIDKHQFVYVGAGLTAKSDPEAEWLETEEKARIVRLT